MYDARYFNKINQDQLFNMFLSVFIYIINSYQISISIKRMNIHVHVNHYIQKFII